MMEFNPDGSLKLPGALARQKEDGINRMKTSRCMRIRKDVVSTYAPKKCVLHITLSDILTDNRFVGNLYAFFSQKSTTPTVFRKIDDNNFEVEIGSDFRRCSDCNALISRYRELLGGNIIEQNGGCTFEGSKSFSYEDYFD